MKSAGRRRLVGQPLLYAISCFASLGVFLFGYDQGVMSGIITGPHFINAFSSPDAFHLGSMVAVLEIGAMITSIAAGRVGDLIGRRGTLFTGAVIFTIGGAIQTFSNGFWSMILGRIISGAGVGLLSTIVPIYQSEVSPASHRGALACAEFSGNIFGYAFSVWVDYFCSFINSDLSWRIPLFIQCIIGFILAIGSIAMPESPRWLLDTDRDEEGLKVLVDLHGGEGVGDVKGKEEFREIKDKVNLEREEGAGRGYSVMWNRYKQRVLLAMSSQAFAQLNGINVISYYAPRVFEEAGWLGRQALLMTGINSIVYLASTIPPWILVDRWGRRPILLSGACVCGISLCLTGLFMWMDTPATPNAVVACVIIFNASFGYSWGPIPWLYPPEIMPLTFRAKGVSLSTATNWAFNFLVGEVTPVLQEVIQWRVYVMHGFFCACSFVLVYFLYPETKGVPLEEMDAVFGEAPSHSTRLPQRHASSSATARLLPDSAPSYPPAFPGRAPKATSTANNWFTRILSLGFRSSSASAPQPHQERYQPLREEPDPERGEALEMDERFKLHGDADEDEEDADDGYEVLEREQGRKL